MYSLSQRLKSTTVGNPNLGPGCYTQDQQQNSSLAPDESYAPFSSLSRRVCAFDEMVNADSAPGIYDGIVERKEGGAMFGKSLTRRFRDVPSHSPGPGEYTLKGLEPKFKARTSGMPGIKLNVMDREIDAVVKVTERPKTEDIRRLSVLGGPELTGVNLKKGKEGRTSKGDQKVTWRRKYVPPSIPMGDNTFGYIESSNGDLVPRKAPRRFEGTQESYNLAFSFVERSKHEKRGFKFGKSQTRLSFDVRDGPGPSDYTSPVESKGVSGAIMTLSPCVRLTDVVIRNELKYGIPGPGSYEMPSTIDTKLKKHVKGGKLSTSTGDRLSLAEQEGIAAPGPGSYYVKDSISTVRNAKNKPFGKSTGRFEEERNRMSVPAPGAYKVDSTMIEKKPYRGGRYKPFGSHTQRFQEEKVNADPGPGAYEASKTENPLGFSTYNYLHHFTPKQNRLAGYAGVSIAPRKTRGGEVLNDEEPTEVVVRKGKLKILVRDVVPDQAPKAHVPVFGSQGNRFIGAAARGSDLNPPPGAYQITNSFDKVKAHGKMNVGMRNAMTRPVYIVDNGVPGPGSYKDTTTVMVAPKGDGKFLSSEERFQDKFLETKPAPNEYLGGKEYGKNMLKKTFNISLGLNERRRIEAMGY